MVKPVEPISLRAIIDASSAILLAKAGLIEACCDAFQLLMTRSVFDEVTVPLQLGAGGLRALAERQPGIIVIEDPGGLSTDGRCDEIQRLHRGERDTLIHYLNGMARFVVIDDGKGFQVCQRHAIPHVNALLMPKMLYLIKRLSAHQARSAFLRICRIGRYSATVVAWAEKCGRPDLAFFLGRS